MQPTLTPRPRPVLSVRERREAASLRDAQFRLSERPPALKVEAGVARTGPAFTSALPAGG